jgi:hypothetical protein
MYRPNFCENLSYPFVRFGDGTRNISAPIFKVLATILMATGSPVVIAGTKEFDTSWLDIAVNELPKFNHYRSSLRSRSTSDQVSLPISSLRWISV